MLIIHMGWYLIISMFKHVQFPYYDFVDREAMYKVGCLFYAIYFIVSFPMFLRLVSTEAYNIISYFMVQIQWYKYFSFSSSPLLPLLLNILLLSFYYFRIDEKLGDKWDLARVAIDALGAAMLVTIILDLWRIFLGPIVPLPLEKQCSQSGLPWFPDHVSP